MYFTFTTSASPYYRSLGERFFSYHPPDHRADVRLLRGSV